MNNKVILKLACKILGIYLLFTGLSHFKNFILFSAPLFLNKETMAEINQHYDYQLLSFFITLASALFDIVVGLLLFFSANWVVNRLDRRTPEEGVQLPVERSVFIELTVIGIGVFLAASSLSLILTNLLEYVVANRQDAEARRLFWESSARPGRVMFGVIEFIVGMVLASNGKPIGRRLARVGDANTRPAEADKV